MPDNAKKTEQKQKEGGKDLLKHLYGEKLAMEKAELPVRSSYFNKKLNTYTLVDLHDEFRYVKDEIWRDVAKSLLKRRIANEEQELPIRDGYVNTPLPDTPFSDEHYQKLKEEICKEILKRLLEDNTGKNEEVLKERNDYLQTMQEKTIARVKKEIALRLKKKGMAASDIAEAEDISVAELDKLLQH